MSAAPLLSLAAGGMLVSILAGRGAERVWLTATLAGMVAALAAAVTVLAGGADWEWRSGFLVGGEALQFRLDAISAFFLVLLCVVGGVCAVYGREYWADVRHPRSYAQKVDWLFKSTIRSEKRQDSPVRSNKPPPRPHYRPRRSGYRSRPNEVATHLPTTGFGLTLSSTQRDTTGR